MDHGCIISFKFHAFLPFNFALVTTRPACHFQCISQAENLAAKGWGESAFSERRQRPQISAQLTSSNDVRRDYLLRLKYRLLSLSQSSYLSPLHGSNLSLTLLNGRGKLLSCHFLQMLNSPG